MILCCTFNFKTYNAVPKPLFNRVAGLRPPTLVKKRLWYGCFPVRNNFCNLVGIVSKYVEFGG